MRRATIAGLVVLFTCLGATTHAAKLVVMGVNLNGDAPAGQKVITIGVDTQGVSGFLAVSGISFKGTGTFFGGSPKQGNYEAPFNGFDEDDFDDINLNTRQQVQDLPTAESRQANFLRYDSWWYVSASQNGLLRDNNGTTVTNDRIVGSSGFLWIPWASGITGGGNSIPPTLGSGSDMGFTGTYGPFPTEVSAGIYPLLQIRTSGDLEMAFTPGKTFLSVQPSGGAEIRSNLCGGQNLERDPGMYLSFYNPYLFAVCPEPSSYVLAGLGFAGLLLFRRKYGRRR